MTGDFLIKHSTSSSHFQVVAEDTSTKESATADLTVEVKSGRKKTFTIGPFPPLNFYTNPNLKPRVVV